MKKLLATALVLVLALTLLAGCAPKEAATGGETVPAETANDTLRAMWSAQQGTDSTFESPTRDAVQCLYTPMVFDRLISCESDGTVGYRLATAHTVSEDGLTYTFTLRDGVKWHDGTDFTAADVAFTFWAYLADPKCSYKSGAANIVGAADVTDSAATELSGVAVDGNTVTVTLSQPYSLFLNDVAFMFILPQHLLGEVAAEELATYEAYWKQPVGLGQYKIESVTFPDNCVLVANDDYYGAKAGIPKVQLTSYATGGTDAAVNALSSGELDFAYGNEFIDITLANSIIAINPDVKILESVSNYQRQFLFNFVESADGQLHPDLAKKEVRQALNKLIDKQAIAELFGSNAAALTTHINPDSEAYNTSVEPFERDVEGAKAMLDAAGFDYSHPIRIAYYYTSQNVIDAMDLVVQNFADAGITASAALLDGDLGTLIYVDRNYDILFCGEAADDPAQMYFWLLGAGDGSYFNDIIGDKDVRATLIDALTTEYFATNDRAKQKELTDQLQVNGLDECAIAPVICLKKLELYNSKKLTVPASVFEVDWRSRDWKFEDWKLN